MADLKNFINFAFGLKEKNHTKKKKKLYTYAVYTLQYTQWQYIHIDIQYISLLAHGDSDIVSHSSVDSVNTEATEQQQLLKGWQVLLVFHREWSLFWSI